MFVYSQRFESTFDPFAYAITRPNRSPDVLFIFDFILFLFDFLKQQGIVSLESSYRNDNDAVDEQDDAKLPQPIQTISATHRDCQTVMSIGASTAVTLAGDIVRH